MHPPLLQLKSGSYVAPHEFLADVQQVWENCLMVSTRSELGLMRGVCLGCQVMLAGEPL